ncbi:MAG TPA: MotA/TolQ/ExbB proton channel family protein, partial [Salinisphaeraceae bacterium]|nr:MotA/TolQ/ExbB proton channel family protein [Salinisphaeraceae bacterium]
MDIATDMSLWGLIVQASTLVKAIMLLLLLASIGSWIVIFSKRRLLKLLYIDMEWFEERFWSGGNLKDIYTQTAQEFETTSGMPALFCAGYEELRRQRSQDNQDAADLVGSIQRAMRVVLSRELEQMESGLTMLATVGSISPYVGLFGTV